MITCFGYNFIIKPPKVVWNTALINVLFSAFLNYSSQMVLYLCYCWRFPAEVVWLLKKNMWWHYKITVIELLGMLEHLSLLSLFYPHLGNKFVNKALWHIIWCLCEIVHCVDVIQMGKWLCVLLKQVLFNISLKNSFSEWKKKALKEVHF